MHGTEGKKANRIIRITIVVAVVIIAAFVVAVFMHHDNRTDSFIGADRAQIDAYEVTDQGEIGDKTTLARGTRLSEVDGHVVSVNVDTLNIKAEPDQTETKSLQLELVRVTTACGKEYFVSTENITEDRTDIVRETSVFVRTPVTIYENRKGPEIAGFAKKGTELQIVSHSKVQKDGTVKKYEVTIPEGCGDGETGYVYGKYMAATKEEADAVYNEHGEYDAAKKAKYSFELYGGSAKNLDYYPVEKPKIKGAKFCDDARAMYLNYVAAVNDKYYKLAVDSGCNAVVMDVKSGGMAYDSEVCREYSPTSYKSAYSSKEKYRKYVQKYKDAGIYTIGRIVCFSDGKYAKDNPDTCIKTSGSSKWPSAYSRKAWEYNVKLAIEAVKEMGFDEIQFDYIRFPETAYDMSKSKSTDFRNEYDEEKAQALQNFCFYAADQIHEAGAYFSIDVFGEASNGYVPSYGQYWPALSNVVDAISSMPYTDHFGDNNTWTNPYGIVYSWAKGAAKCQKQIPTPAAARTWITGYNTPWWNPTVNYGEAEMKAQIKALDKAGLEGGFIPWNSASDLGKYYQYKGIWKDKK